jgi:hypothetical protein
MCEETSKRVFQQVVFVICIVSTTHGTLHWYTMNVSYVVGTFILKYPRLRVPRAWWRAQGARPEERHGKRAEAAWLHQLRAARCHAPRSREPAVREWSAQGSRLLPLAGGSQRQLRPGAFSCWRCWRRRVCAPCFPVVVALLRLGADPLRPHCDWQLASPRGRPQRRKAAGRQAQPARAGSLAR